jgi:hypothetical protein
MSLIHACRLNEVNPFDYLLAIATHAEAVKLIPRSWLPWNDAEGLRGTVDWMEAAERPPNVRGFIHVLDEEVHPFAGVWKFAKSRLKLCN